MAGKQRRGGRGHFQILDQVKFEVIHPLYDTKHLDLLFTAVKSDIKSTIPAMAHKTRDGYGLKFYTFTKVLRFSQTPNW